MDCWLDGRIYNNIYIFKQMDGRKEEYKYEKNRWMIRRIEEKTYEKNDGMLGGQKNR